MFTDLGVALRRTGPQAPGIAGAGRLARRLARSELLQALAAPHGVERYVELVVPSFSLREGRGEVVDVRRTAGSVTLRLRPNARWRGFVAGQSVPVAVELDGVRRARCYSPANSQHAADGTLELTVRRHAQGLVSRHLHDSARPGMVLGLGEPEGEFVLPSPRPRRLWLISGGSGITPVMSMLRTLCDEGHDAPVTFLHYAPSAREVAYRRELEDLAARHGSVQVACVYTRERDGSLRGHLCAAHLRALDRAYPRAQVYVCGPPSLIAAARRLWGDAGQRQRVHVESFLPARMAPARGGAAGTVRFASSGIEVACDGATTLLDRAEGAGITPAYGCRRGICHTCTTRKRAGRVRNLLSGELSCGEPEDIQLCVSVAAGDVELEL